MDAQRDLIIMVRSLARRPGFCLAVILTLGFGIGAVTTVFTIVDNVILRPLDLPEPERLVRVWGTNSATGRASTNVNPWDVRDWEAGSEHLEGIATLRLGGATRTDGEVPTVLRDVSVSSNFFKVLGVDPVLGRGFLPEEQTPGDHRVIVISHRFWMSELGADLGAVGRTIELDEVPFTVIGVLPEGFEDPMGGEHPSLWRPMPLPFAQVDRGGHYVRAIGRLAEGASIEQAQAEIDAVAQRLAEQFPETNVGMGGRLEPLIDSIVGNARNAFLLLFGAVVFLLLICCVNVGNLVTVRNLSRRREVGVRAALGSTRGGLVRLLLSESLTLALLGGLLGLVLAHFSLGLLSALGANVLPRSGSIQIDLQVFGFALFLSLSTALIFGLVPALRGSRVELQSVLKEGDEAPVVVSGLGSVQRLNVRSLLMVVQFALALILLVGAGLMTRSLQKLLDVDAGFDAHNVLTSHVMLPPSRYPQPSRISNFYQELFSRYSKRPNVEAIGAINSLPLTGGYSCDGFDLRGRPSSSAGERTCADQLVASPGYFEAMGLEVVAGRPFEESDNADSQPVVLINETMARTYFPDEDPIGHEFIWFWLWEEQKWSTIVGVVEDVKQTSLKNEYRPAVYMPLKQNPVNMAFVVVRSADGVDTSSLVNDFRSEVWALDANLPVMARPMAELVSRSVTGPRLLASLLGAFAIGALGLAAVGIYATVAYSVNRRHREIGIRMALGSSAGGVARKLLGEGVVLLGAGLLLGLAGSLALARLVESLLYQTSATDLATLAGASSLLVLAALIAIFFPAWRAARLNPVIAMKSEQ